MRVLSLLLLLIPSKAFSQQWNQGFHPPLDFRYNTNHNQGFQTNAPVYPWHHNSVTYSPNQFASQQAYAAPPPPLPPMESPHAVAPPPAPAEQTFVDSVVQSNGVPSDVRRSTTTNMGAIGTAFSDDGEINSGNERQARKGRSHHVRQTRSQSAPAPVQESITERSYTMEELKNVCPPPTIKYIVLRTLKNGLELAEEAVEMPVTSSLAHHKIPKDVQDMFGIGSNKREVAPSESSSKKNRVVHSTTTHAPDDLDALPTQDMLDTAEEVVEVDDKCNSDSLRKLIVNNIVPGDAGGSKRNIHNAVPASAPAVDVICSTTGFTYLVTTTDHCEAQADGVICFAYRNDQ